MAFLFHIFVHLNSCLQLFSLSSANENKNETTTRRRRGGGGEGNDEVERKKNAEHTAHLSYLPKQYECMSTLNNVYNVTNVSANASPNEGGEEEEEQKERVRGRETECHEY